MVTKHQAEERDELEKMLSQKELKLEDLRNSQPIYTVKNVSVLWSLVRLLVLSKMSMDLFGPCQWFLAGPSIKDILVWTKCLMDSLDRTKCLLTILERKPKD